MISSAMDAAESTSYTTEDGESHYPVQTLSVQFIDTPKLLSNVDKLSSGSVSSAKKKRKKRWEELQKAQWRASRATSTQGLETIVVQVNAQKGNIKKMIKMLQVALLETPIKEIDDDAFLEASEDNSSAAFQSLEVHMKEGESTTFDAFIVTDHSAVDWLFESEETRPNNNIFDAPTNDAMIAGEAVCADLHDEDDDLNDLNDLNDDDGGGRT